MINEQPRKLVLTEVKGGYNKIYITNSQPYDADILGRAFWLKNVATGSVALHTVDALTNYATISALQPSTQYEVIGAFYDSMVDSQLLAAKALIELSDPVVVETKGGPVILNITGENIDVDIGVVLPNLLFQMDGSSDTLILEYKEEGTNTWVEFYSGAMSTKVSVPAPKVGKFRFRAKGVVYTNAGEISEVSPYTEYAQVVDASFNLVNPTAPSNVVVKVGKVNDTFERYDVKVSWDWEKGSGAGLKAFVVSYVSTAEHAISGFSKAKTISAGTANSTIIPNFPYGIPHKLKVTAYSYSDTNNSGESTVLNLTITSSTQLDTNFTKATLVDVSYSGIRGYRQYGSEKIHTFSLDAATGTMGLGTPNLDGTYPIQLNGNDGTLTVDGGIITKKINAASFILTNFTGKDNPALYTEGKLYGSGVPGIWMGYDNTSGLYKFDLGNSAKYIRWDGSDLLISGSVKIGTALGAIDLESTVAKRVVWVYKEASTKPPTPIGDAYPPSGWYTAPVAITSPNNVVWASQGLLNEITNKLEPGNTWSGAVQFSGSRGVDGDTGDAGDSSFKSTVFKRSNTRPSAPTGGSYNSPVPSGWSDGAPDGTTILWASSRIFTKSGAAPQQAAWSTPAQLTDTATQEIRYSQVASNPGTPSTNPANWTTTANVYTIWMAVRIQLNGVWNSWNVSKIKGENGANGTNGTNGSRGAGFYVVATSTGAWSDSTANAATPGSSPVKDDVVTIFKQTDTKVSTTKRYNGSAWVAPGLVVHGDMIATGTIAGDRITAGTEIVAPVIRGGSVQLVGTAYMKLQSSEPFGPDGLIEWFGPRILVGGNPDLTQVRKGNAITYLSADGDAYFGGSLSAGILKNGAENTQIGDYWAGTAGIEIGPFGTNGNTKTLVVSWSSHAYSSNYINDPGTVSPPTMSWKLQKSVGASWTDVTSGYFEGVGSSGYEPENGKWWARWVVGASTTFNDESTSTQNVSYRVLVTAYNYTASNSTRIYQRLSLICTEQ